MSGVIAYRNGHSRRDRGSTANNNFGMSHLIADRNRSMLRALLMKGSAIVPHRENEGESGASEMEHIENDPTTNECHFQATKTSEV